MTRRGFTLLEVMISLLILSVGLVAVLDLNAGSMRMHSYATRVTVATLLARGKMLDIEAELRKEGFGDFDKDLNGDFDEEGWPEFKWEAHVKKPDVQLSADDLVNVLAGKGGAEGEGGGMLGDMLRNLGQAAGGAGSQLGGAVMPIIQAQATKFFEEIKKAVREVTLTVTWKDGRSTESMDVTTLLVLLDAGNPQTQQVQLP